MAHSNIKFCIRGDEWNHGQALRAEGSLLRREGRPGDVIGPRRLGRGGGCPRSKSLPNFDGLDTLKVSGQFSCQYPSLQAEEPSRLGPAQAPLAGISQKGFCVHGLSHHFERLGQ